MTPYLAGEILDVLVYAGRRRGRNFWTVAHVAFIPLAKQADLIMAAQVQARAAREARASRRRQLN